jgi:prepilin-type N-terminal cleavage/methylation domain-containing protein
MTVAPTTLMKPFASCYFRRYRVALGFTLVEILVVIAIIGILVGLAVPAITGAIKTGNNAALRTEIEGLSQAIEAYKLKYNDYPPDFVSWPIVERHYRRAFPNIAQSEINLLKRLTDDDAANDYNFMLAISTTHNPVAMDRAEAIVWALGGFSSNPQLPFTGADGPLSQVPNAPTGETVYQINNGRSSALFEFKSNLLTTYGSEGGTKSVDPAAGLSKTNRYLSTDDDDLFLTYISREGGAPYVYFDSRTYSFQVGTEFNGYAGPGGSVRPFLSDRPVLNSAAGPYASIAAALTGWEFMNPQTFQLICGGLDDNLGVLEREPSSSPPMPIYFQYPSGNAVWPKFGAGFATPKDLIIPKIARYQDTELSGKIENPTLDNLTNFSATTFEDDLP